MNFVTKKKKKNHHSYNSKFGGWKIERRMAPHFAILLGEHSKFKMTAWLHMQIKENTGNKTKMHTSIGFNNFCRTLPTNLFWSAHILSPIPYTGKTLKKDGDIPAQIAFISEVQELED